MRPLVDEDLAADELVAVKRLVEDEVARVTDQHPAVLSAEHFRQPLEGELVDVQTLWVARDGRVRERVREVVNDRVPGQRVGEDRIALNHIPVLDGLVWSEELRAV